MKGRQGRIAILISMVIVFSIIISLPSSVAQSDVCPNPTRVPLYIAVFFHSDYQGDTAYIDSIKARITNMVNTINQRAYNKDHGCDGRRNPCIVFDPNIVPYFLNENDLLGKIGNQRVSNGFVILTDNENRKTIVITDMVDFPVFLILSGNDDIKALVN